MLQINHINSEQQQIQNQIKKYIPQPLQILPYILTLVPPRFLNFKMTPFLTNKNKKQLEKINNNFVSKQIKSQYELNQRFIYEYQQNKIYIKYDFWQDDGEFKNLIKCKIKRMSQKLEIENYFLNYKRQKQILMFDSHFESGNLSLVFKISDNQYNLILNNDINTQNYSQWFFFKVMAVKPAKIKFNIINFYKKKSLFQKGMKIVILNKKKQQNQQYWEKGGQAIQYKSNSYDFNNHKNFTLSFKYNFQKCNQQVYFAYHYPYTYSDLINWLSKLNQKKYPFLKINILCNTLSKNNVYYLTITSNAINKYKQIIYLSARTHPGQTISSYIIQNLTNFLLSNDSLAKQLRQKFIFKIVPMVNPDGVINGNSRCSLYAKDLNRSWENPSSQFLPQIYYYKKLILKDHNNYKIFLICDFHGHSFRKGSFIYGCHNKSNPFSTRQFPWILSKLNKQFDYKHSSFIIQKQKHSTLRINLWKTLKISNVFTLQTSFCGPLNSDFHWTNNNIQNLCYDFCKTIKILSFDDIIDNNNFTLIQKQSQIRIQYLSELYQNPQNYLCNISNEESDVQVSDIQQKRECKTEEKQCKTLKVESKKKINNIFKYTTKLQNNIEKHSMKYIQRNQRYNIKSRNFQWNNNSNQNSEDHYKNQLSTIKKQYYRQKTLKQIMVKTLTQNIIQNQNNKSLFINKDQYTSTPFQKEQTSDFQKLFPLKYRKKKTYIYSKGRNFVCLLKQRLNAKKLRQKSLQLNFQKLKKDFCVKKAKFENRFVQYVNHKQKSQIRNVSG